MQLVAIVEPRSMSYRSDMADFLSSHEKAFLRRVAGKTDREVVALRFGATAEQVPEQRAPLLAKLNISEPDEIAQAAERLASWRSYRGVT